MGRAPYFLFLLFWGAILPCAQSAATNEVTEELPAIHVFGRKPLKQMPGETSEFDGESLEVQSLPEHTLPQILRQSTAVTVRESGGDGSAPEFLLRGQDPQQTRYFLEGIPLSDAEFNSGNLGLLPVENLARIDIYPEGVPVFLGEDGLGGALQFRLEGLDSPAPAYFGARVGSYQYYKAYGETSTDQLAHARIHLDYNQSKEDYYYYDNGGLPLSPGAATLQRRDHNSFRRVTILPQVSIFHSDRTRLELLDLAAYGETEVPGPTNLPQSGDLRQVYELAALRLETGKGTGVESDSHLFLRLDSEKLRNQPTQTDDFLPDSYLTESNELALGVRSLWKVHALSIADVELVTGANWDRYRVQDSLDSIDKTDKTRLQVPVGVSARVPLMGRAVSLKPAVLGHFYQYNLGGASVFDATPLAGRNTVSYFLLSPRGGVDAYPLPFLKVRAAAGSYYRAPSMMELFGTPTTISPSRGLSYERALKGEVGADAEFSKPLDFLSAVRVSYTYSRARAHDLISFVQNSQQTRVATNVGESEIGSHEISIEAQTPWHFTARSGLTLLDTVNLTPSPYQFRKNLPNRPRYRGEMDLDFHTKRWGFTYSLSLNGPVYWDVANLMRMDSTAEHSVFVSWDSQSFGLFVLELRNLTDVITASSTYGDTSIVDNNTGYLGYPAPGRRVYLSWKYEI